MRNVIGLRKGVRGEVGDLRRGRENAASVHLRSLRSLRSFWSSGDSRREGSGPNGSGHWLRWRGAPQPAKD